MVKVTQKYNNLNTKGVTTSVFKLMSSFTFFCYVELFVLFKILVYMS
jgi:hypothetical protein